MIIGGPVEIHQSGVSLITFIFQLLPIWNSVRHTWDPQVVPSPGPDHSKSSLLLARWIHPAPNVSLIEPKNHWGKNQENLSKGNIWITNNLILLRKKWSLQWYITQVMYALFVANLHIKIK